jgi:hypothetical protein
MLGNKPQIFLFFIFDFYNFILQMFDMFNFIKKSIVDWWKNNEFTLTLWCFVTMIIKIWSQILIIKKIQTLGNNGTIIIIWKECVNTIYKLMCEWFKTINYMWFKCYCVYNLYCLLIGIKQNWLKFVPTIWQPFWGQKILF